MARAKKAKRDDRIVVYVRVKPAEHAQIVEIAEKRGYPYTIASVLAEGIAQWLATEKRA